MLRFASSPHGSRVSIIGIARSTFTNTRHMPLGLGSPPEKQRRTCWQDCAKCYGCDDQPELEGVLAALIIKGAYSPDLIGVLVCP